MMEIMAWKKEIRQLRKDFKIRKRDYDEAIRNARETKKQRQIPKYYKGDENAWMYDLVYRRLVACI